MKKHFFAVFVIFALAFSVSLPAYAFDASKEDDWKKLAWGNAASVFTDGYSEFVCETCGHQFTSNILTGAPVCPNCGAQCFVDNGDGSGYVSIVMPDDSPAFGGMGGGSAGSSGGAGGSFGYSAQGKPAVSSGGTLRFYMYPEVHFQTSSYSDVLVLADNNRSIPFSASYDFPHKYVSVVWSGVLPVSGTYTAVYGSADNIAILNSGYYHQEMLCSDYVSSKFNFTGSVGVTKTHNAKVFWYGTYQYNTPTVDFGSALIWPLVYDVVPNSNAPTITNNLTVNGVLLNGDFYLYNNNYFNYNSNGDVNIYYTDETGDVVSSSTYNTTNNVYYITVYNVPAESTPTPTPEPTPEPSTTPETPTPTPIPGGNDGDNNNYFGDGNTTGEDGSTGDNNSFITSLFQKFQWWKPLAEMMQALSADIFSDSASAYAIADGDIMTMDLDDGTQVQVIASTGNAVTAPQIILDLSAAESPSGINYGMDSVNVLDLSWYARYKPSVDALLSGILWICFLWRLFMHAPGIISGVSGDVETIEVPRSTALTISGKMRRL